MGQLHHKSVQHDADCLLSCNVSSYVPPICPRNTDATSEWLYRCTYVYISQCDVLLFTYITACAGCDCSACCLVFPALPHAVPRLQLPDVVATHIFTVISSEWQFQIDIHNGTGEQSTVTCVSAARRGDWCTVLADLMAWYLAKVLANRRGVSIGNELQMIKMVKVI